jgi:hypothetical protein
MRIIPGWASCVPQGGSAALRTRRIPSVRPPLQLEHLGQVLTWHPAAGWGEVFGERAICELVVDYLAQDPAR